MDVRLGGPKIIARGTLTERFLGAGGKVGDSKRHTAIRDETVDEGGGGGGQQASSLFSRIWRRGNTSGLRLSAGKTWTWTRSCRTAPFCTSSRNSPDRGATHRRYQGITVSIIEGRGGGVGCCPAQPRSRGPTFLVRGSIGGQPFLEWVTARPSP